MHTCCDIVRDTSLPVMATIRERFRISSDIAISATRFDIRNCRRHDPRTAEQRDEIATPRKKPDSGIAAPCMLLGVCLLFFGVDHLYRITAPATRKSTAMLASAALRQEFGLSTEDAYVSLTCCSYGVAQRTRALLAIGPPVIGYVG